MNNLVRRESTIFNGEPFVGNPPVKVADILEVYADRGEKHVGIEFPHLSQQEIQEALLLCDFAFVQVCQQKAIEFAIQQKALDGGILIGANCQSEAAILSGQVHSLTSKEAGEWYQKLLHRQTLFLTRKNNLKYKRDK